MTIDETIESIDREVNAIISCRDDLMTTRRLSSVLSVQQKRDILSRLQARFSAAITELQSMNLSTTTV